MKTILVTGAGGNASGNFIKSVRERYRVVGVDSSKYHLEGASVDARYVLPKCDDMDYLEKLSGVCKSEGVDFIHPQPDVEVEFISSHRDELPKVFLPSHESIVLCHNKLEANKVIGNAGVSVPRSHLVERVADIPELIDELGGEKVWLRAVRGAGSRAALPVTSSRQAEEWIHYWRKNRALESKDFMLCEFLPGKEFAFQSLWYKGELVTSAARERIEYMFGNLMPSGQSSSPSVAKTVHRMDVNMIATKAVKAVDENPHGVYCVDMKENASGVPSVTEINIGRFFTTSDFFSELGCNMPQMYLDLAFSDIVPEVPKYDAVEMDVYWIRGVDKEPNMVREWTSKIA